MVISPLFVILYEALKSVSAKVILQLLLSIICLTTIATCQYDVIPPFFPQQRQNSQHQAAYQGRLRLVKNCLRVGGFLVIWPEGFSVSTKGKNISINDATGLHVAYIGDHIAFGGSGTETPKANTTFSLKEDDFVLFKQRPAADNCSYPPYWYTNDVKKAQDTRISPVPD